MTSYTPWSNPRDPEILFEIESFNKLLENLDWPDPTKWLNHWLDRGGIDFAFPAWPPETKTDWIWGIGFPFISDIERYMFNEDKRVLLGISGLPGCGKTSFGKWLKAAASELNLPLEVISMDDFYLPSPQLDKAMAGNPWKVPRGLPGSHAIGLLEETIEIWKNTGNLKSPKFDKALRNGFGDRSGWSCSSPKVVVIEGWFLGCSQAAEMSNLKGNACLNDQRLTLDEKAYQVIVQNSLADYQSIWKEFEKIWHLKSIDFNSTKEWKTQQEVNLQNERGSSLRGKSLESFIRMIQVAIPKKDLQLINSDVVALLNRSRQIIWVGLNKHEPH
tara:strand:- start:5 stop:997 length:993 start_codon:yes stop_codon:yes gene_type:complete